MLHSGLKPLSGPNCAETTVGSCIRRWNPYTIEDGTLVLGDNCPVNERAPWPQLAAWEQVARVAVMDQEAPVVLEAEAPACPPTGLVLAA
jgi:hypothetical protein